MDFTMRYFRRTPKANVSSIVSPAYKATLRPETASPHSPIQINQTIQYTLETDNG